MELALTVIKHGIQKTDQDIMALFRAKDFLERKISFWTNKSHMLMPTVPNLILATMYFSLITLCAQTQTKKNFESAAKQRFQNFSCSSLDRQLLSYDRSGAQPLHNVCFSDRGKVPLIALPC
jgi:hypothetical protein